MVDAKRLLDALIGGAQRPPGQGGGQGAGPNILQEVMNALTSGGARPSAGQVFNQATSGLTDAASRLNRATGVGEKVDATARQVTGIPSTGDLASQAKGFFERNPGMAQAAIGLAGLVLTSRQGRGLTRNVAGLGGLALIGGLAYKAFQNYQSGQPLLDAGQGGPSAGQGAIQSAPQVAPPASPTSGTAQSSNPLQRSVPPVHASNFDPERVTEDDALLYVRTMVAAASADGHIDENERQKIMRGLQEAGIDPAGSRWLEDEFSNPADVETLSAGVKTPEKAAQVYAAARIAVDADTLQEREFLRRLAQALDLDARIIAEIDAGADAVKA